MAQYTVPEQYAGKSIRQLAQGGFDPTVYMSGEELSRQLGVGWETPLTAGQTLSTSWNDTGHGDYGLLKYFNPVTAASTLAESQKQMNEALAPAINSLESSKPITQQLYAQQAENLKQTSSNIEKRYDALLSSLVGEEKRTENDIGLATSREWGKRGISLSSGAYDEALLEKYKPTREYYSGLTQQTGVAREGDLMKISQALALNPIELQGALNSIQQAIAAIQTGGAKDAISNSINQSQFQASIDQKNKELAQAMEISKREQDYMNPYYRAYAQSLSGSNSKWDPSSNSWVPIV